MLSNHSDIGEVTEMSTKPENAPPTDEKYIVKAVEDWNAKAALKPFA